MLLTIFIILVTLIILIILTKKYPMEIYRNAFIANIPFPNSLLRLHNNLFKISVFQSKYEKNNFMMIIYPQHYHFFIQDSISLIYHPNNDYLDAVLKQYRCNTDFELAYKIPINNTSFSPKVICHRKLSYLKKYIYTNKSTYEKCFNELQNPINAIYVCFNEIIKK